MKTLDCHTEPVVNSVVFVEAKAKPEESLWVEVVSLNGTGWWPGAYFTKWLNGKTKSVHHEMREILGFLSHSESYKKSFLKKGVTPVDFINKCSSESVPAITDLWVQPGLDSRFYSTNPEFCSNIILRNSAFFSLATFLPFTAATVLGSLTS